MFPEIQLSLPIFLSPSETGPKVSVEVSKKKNLLWLEQIYFQNIQE